MKNVISKVNSSFNIETVLVLDGTNGSNMIKQVEIFGNELNVSSLIITKLDGTAKGGALISIANKFKKKFKNKAELDIMFSNDIKKYPVMIRLKLKYGYLKLELDRVIN